MTVHPVVDWFHWTNPSLDAFFTHARHHSPACQPHFASPPFAAAKQDTRSESSRRQVALGDSSNTLLLKRRNAASRPPFPFLRRAIATLVALPRTRILKAPSPILTRPEPSKPGSKITKGSIHCSFHGRAEFCIAFPFSTFPFPLVRIRIIIHPSLPNQLPAFGIVDRSRPQCLHDSTTVWTQLPIVCTGQNPLAPSSAIDSRSVLRLLRDRIASV